MALKITTLEDQEKEMKFKLEEDLCLTADKNKVVPVGHPEAKFLLGRKGALLDPKEAIRLGLVKEKKPRTDAPDLNIEKAAPKSKDKAAKKSENKGKK